MTETLLPCRCCGDQPKLGRYSAICKNCNFDVIDYATKDSDICYSDEFIQPRLKEIWNRRNEKNNPFLTTEQFFIKD